MFPWGTFKIQAIFLQSSSLMVNYDKILNSHEHINSSSTAGATENRVDWSHTYAIRADPMSVLGEDGAPMLQPA